MSKPALGRGLGALLGSSPARPPIASPSPENSPPTVGVVDNRERVLRVKLDRIKPSPLQPRKDFTPEALQELAASIKEQGIVQPLIVREADDRSVLELALIENLQRENLNAMEEALGYSQLVEQFQLRQEDVAIKVGKSRVAVANALRLLKLTPEIQAYVRDGRISVGHAKVILSLASGDHQKLAAERVLKDGMTVRQAEELVAHLQNQPAASQSKTTNGLVVTNRDANVVSLEGKLRERFGTKVQLRYRNGKGAVEIKFFSEDDLQRILGIIGVKVD